MIRVVIFSKDRPLQLHGTLTSLFAQWRTEPEQVDVCVLMRGEDGPFEAAYQQVRNELKDRVAFWWEYDFPSDLQGILSRDGAASTCFACDDVVYTLPFDPSSIPATFRDTDDLLGVSLRLGRNITRDMFGRGMAQPAFLPQWGESEYPYDGGLCWDATDGRSVGDWGYAWEVLGTVYPTEVVRDVVDRLVKDGQCGSPSQLEHHGSTRWREVTDRHLLRAATSSRLVVPTVNLVQSEFPNGIVGGGGLDPLFLLECWNRGLRLDTQRLMGQTPPSWRIGDFPLRRAS